MAKTYALADKSNTISFEDPDIYFHCFGLMTELWYDTFLNGHNIADILLEVA
jgi:hypothetical protein